MVATTSSTSNRCNASRPVITEDRSGIMHAVVRTFISYRRADNPYLAADVRKRLVARYGEDSVFLDTDSIPLGRDFRAHVRVAMDDVDVVLVLIGSAWQPQRLRNLRDPVRSELLIAQSLEKHVIPVLHSGCKMPSEKELPRTLAWFSYLNAFEIGPPRSAADDIERLVTSLANGPNPQVVTPPARSRWREREAARRRWLLPVVGGLILLAGGFGAVLGAKGARSSLVPGSDQPTAISPIGSSGTPVTPSASTVLSTLSPSSPPTSASLPNPTVQDVTTTARSSTTPKATTTSVQGGGTLSTTTTVGSLTTPVPRLTSLEFGSTLGLRPAMTVQSAGYDASGLRAFALGADQLRLSLGGLVNWVPLSTPTVVQPSRFTHAAFSPTSDRLAAGSSNGLITIWSTESRRVLIDIQVGSTASDVVFDWAPDGKWIVAADTHGTIGVWSATSGAAAWKSDYWPENQTLFRTVAWSPRGNAIAAGTRNGEVSLLSPSTGEKLPGSISVTGSVNHLAWAPGGSLVAAATDIDVYLVRVAGTAPTRLRQPWAVNALCFDPDGREIAVAGKGLQTISASTGDRIASPAASLNGRVFYDVSCSPDGTSLLTVTDSDAAVVRRMIAA